MKLLKLLLLVGCLLVSFHQTNAQYAYGVSDTAYDNISGKVTSISITELDYLAGLHYDPGVVGGIFQEGNLLGYDSDIGYAYIFDAFVGLRTNFAAPPDSNFDVLSDHYIRAYYYITVIIFDDDGTPLPLTKYYDPLGFSRYGGGAESGWSRFQGSNRGATFYEYQDFYLGTTGKGIIANRTTCEGASAPCPTPTPTPLDVKVINTFKSGVDLSEGNVIHNALVGNVRLDALIPTDTTGTVTYKWTSEYAVGPSCSVSKTCLAEFRVPNQGSETYTINLEVKRDNDPPINKSVKIKVSLPQISNLGKQRTPLITTPSNPCVVGTQSSLEHLILGCPDGTYDFNNRLLNIFSTNSIPNKRYGFYAKADLTVPPDLISNGANTWVEIRQIIKPKLQRRGNNVSECVVFSNGSQDGWREDFNGREEIVRNAFEEVNLKLLANFPNTSTNTVNNVTLQFLDSPASALLEVNNNNLPLNTNYREDEFETYISYFTGFTDDPDFGDQNRQALSKLEWEWRGKAVKRNSQWKFSGMRSPKADKDIIAESVTPSETTSGERAFAGTFRVPGTADINGAFEPCGVRSSINMTTPSNVAVWRKSNGVWWVVKPDGTTQATQWGVDYDIPVPADYEGDGLADFAVFRPDDPATSQDECAGSCVWYILKSTDNNWQTAYFGSKDDIPTPADFDGDGTADISVFRPSTNTWHVTRSSDSGCYNVVFGSSGDTPLPSDYDGDGIDDLAMWSPSTATWSVKNSSDQTTTTQQWGTYTDIPVIGDYDGDGKTDFANWQSNGDWHILLSADGQIKTENFGVFSTDVPVPGNYDGDDKTDIAVWRPNASQASAWYIKRSSDNQVEVRFLGLAGDVPIPAAYNR